jgi:hypothetical protein
VDKSSKYYVYAGAAFALGAVVLNNWGRLDTVSGIMLFIVCALIASRFWEGGRLPTMKPELEEASVCLEQARKEGSWFITDGVFDNVGGAVSFASNAERLLWAVKKEWRREDHVLVLNASTMRPKTRIIFSGTYADFVYTHKELARLLRFVSPNRSANAIETMEALSDLDLPPDAKSELARTSIEKSNVEAVPGA